MKLIALLCVLLLPISSYCLTCQEGYTYSITSTGTTESVMNTTECPDNGTSYACFRADSSFLLKGRPAGTGSFFYCLANPNSTCITARCNILTEKNSAINVTPKVTQVLSAAMVSVNQCAQVCCTADNCNNVAVKEVLNRLIPVVTSTAIATTTAGARCNLPYMEMIFGLGLLLAIFLGKIF